MNGDIYASGNVTAFSDARFKKDIEVITDALSKAQQLRGVTYHMVGDSPAGPPGGSESVQLQPVNPKLHVTKRRCVGLLAQDVQAVLPEAVSTGSEGLLSIAYGNLSALLVEAVKELAERTNNAIEGLTQRQREYDTRLDALCKAMRERSL